MKLSKEDRKRLTKSIEAVNNLGSAMSNFEKQALIATENMKIFNEVLIKNLLKKNFNVKIVHDSIIVEKDSNENS
jgi:hypothetical protein